MVATLVEVAMAVVVRAAVATAAEAAAMVAKALELDGLALVADASQVAMTDPDLVGSGAAMVMEEAMLAEVAVVAAVKEVVALVAEASVTAWKVVGTSAGSPETVAGCKAPCLGRVEVAEAVAKLGELAARVAVVATADRVVEGQAVEERVAVAQEAVSMGASAGARAE